MLTSTGSAGECYDNAMAESFFTTLESNLIVPRAFRTRMKARLAICQFNEGSYTPARRNPDDLERAAMTKSERCPPDNHGLQGQKAPAAFQIPQSDLHATLRGWLFPRESRKPCFKRLPPTSTLPTTALYCLSAAAG